jgi:hypothetical protein
MGSSLLLFFSFVFLFVHIYRSYHPNLTSYITYHLTDCFGYVVVQSSNLTLHFVCVAFRCLIKLSVRLSCYH